MSVLGLDYGSKTVGVAVTSLDDIVVPLETITRDKEESIKKTISRLKEIIKERDVNLIILGNPISMSGKENERTLKTQLFKERLERNFKKIPVILWDERLTTFESKNILTDMGIKAKMQKQGIDKTAASLILQSYIENIRRNDGRI